MKREEGAVLLVVLVALAILAALAGVALRLGTAGLHGLAAERAEFAREILAPSALAVIGQRMAGPDALPDDATPVVLSLPEGRVEVRLQAAGGLINPAHIRLPILQAALVGLGASPEQAVRLTRSVGLARGERIMAGNADLAPLFAGDLAIWPKLAPYLTFLGSRTTVDPQTAPPLLRQALAATAGAGVDFAQTGQQAGYYEIDLRVLAKDETLKTAKGMFTHYSVLRDKAGRIHLFMASWPQEIGR